MVRSSHSNQRGGALYVHRNNKQTFYRKGLPLGANLLEQTQEVQITNLGNVSNDTAYTDFHLRYDKRIRTTATETAREVLFVQEIPAAAKKSYGDGIADLPKNQEQEIMSKAIHKTKLE